MKQFIFLSLPFLFTILFALLPQKPWFVILEKNEMIYLSVFFLVFQFLVLKFNKALSNSMNFSESILEKNKVWFLLLFFLSMLAFPIRNLNWGDGILLLETNLLETNLFGLQIAMDEIFETSAHSLVYHLLSFFGFSSDNRYSYQIVSFVTGALFITLTGWKLKNEKSDKTELYPSLLFLGSGGFLVFFGYAENYSILSLYLFFILFLIRYWIINEKSSTYLLIGATLLVTVGIYFHLVSGFLAIALFYLWYEFSDKLDKLKHFLICSAIGGGLLLLGFSYLLFLHDPNLDRQSSHLLHPPIYPWKRLISINHLQEIFSVLWWNSKIAIFLIPFAFIFYKEKFKFILQKKENRFLIASALAFFCNGFFINPMLGFPADWDMIGFYWIPLAYIAYLLLAHIPELRLQLLPLVCFSLTLQILQARELSKENIQNEKLIKLTQALVFEYVSENKTLIESLPKSDKKFYAKTDFFLYKAKKISERMCEFPAKQNLITELIRLRNLFRSETASGKLKDKIWIKEFLAEATKGNTFYIKSLEANKLCHLEL